MAKKNTNRKGTYLSSKSDISPNRITLITDVFAESSSLQSYELVDVAFLREGNSWVLRVLIDSPTGIQLCDCEKVSRILSDFLDRNEPLTEKAAHLSLKSDVSPNINRAYNLEVSSPGIERSLKKKADYERFVERYACIYTYTPVKGSKKNMGKIIGVINEELIITKENESIKIPLAKITKAHLTLEREHTCP